MESQDMGIKMEDFVDVVYKCKFCPYTCTQSPEMGLHVRENHLPPPPSADPSTQPTASTVKTDVPCSSGKNPALRVPRPAANTASDTLPSQKTSENSNVNSGITTMQSDDDAGITAQSQAFMDKTLTAASRGSNAIPQYIVSTPGSEPVSVPETTETKEFLLCGLCKLAFTTMEECQAHMQLEHRELMHDTGVSIGVQVGGAKRGRKRKSEQLKKIKVEPEPVDPDDVEWLPSVSDLNPDSHGEGRTRRKIKPPRALKEDYVFGKRTSRKVKGPSSDHGYKLSCPMMGCKAKLKTEEGLRIHMDCHNMEDTALTCKECHAPFDFWKNLRIHLWKKHKEIHSESKPYTCDICGKGFRQASQMKNHQVTHVKSSTKEVGQYWFSAKKCDICDRMFANSKCLKKHKEVVHGNFKPYKCTYCDHTTARKAMMQLHMRTHTGEKPFKCDICNYSTGDHNSLRRHKMRHTGQKQYRCTQCPYTCIQSISLKQHMRHKHPGTSAGIFQCSRCPFRSINQTIYFAHVQDHKKGLIPDKLVHPRVELPKARKVPAKTHGDVVRREIPVDKKKILDAHPRGAFAGDRKKIRHPDYNKVDEALVLFFKQARSQSIPTSSPQLLKKGKEIAESLGLNNFAMS
ncbi:zinc finger protein 813-like [Elysia marginata]|uniref:Zinc finger protein 813-like n=1 Tax=Elysia marginata TaxID=1093978 RepID=A0AAV4EFB0_9GAST|nr:zinc finger protein 813-like [Elysia marginata]